MSSLSRLAVRARVAFVVSLVWGITSVAGAQGQFVEARFAYRGRTVERVIVPGRPPGIIMPAAVARPIASAASTILPDVPAFTWCYGCSPTAAAMIAGHYDNRGFPNMYAGPTNGGVCPLTNAIWGSTRWPSIMCGESPLSASHAGLDGRTSRGHVDDYWVDFGVGGPDPYESNGWNEHNPDCLADFMGTSQADNASITDGATWFFVYTDGTPLVDYTGSEPDYRDGCHGMRLFVESRGYRVFTNFTQTISGNNGVLAGYTFDDFKAEIQSGVPVLIHIQGHSMVGFGYEETGSVIYIRDTWDHQAHTMTWGGEYAGMRHYAVTTLRLDRPPSAPAGCLITPSAPEDDDDLRVVVQGPSTDPNGTGVNYIYQWRMRPPGESYGPWEPGDRELAASHTRSGQGWQARVAGSSGTPPQLSPWSVTQEVVIGNAAPTAPTSLAISPQNPVTSDTLRAVASGSVDPNGDQVSYRYEWSCDGGAWGYASGDGVLDADLLPNQGWRARACATDGVLDSPWTTPVGVRIANRVPLPPTDLQVTPLNPRTNDNLLANASGGSDPDGAAISYVYEWSRMTAEESTWSEWSNRTPVLTKFLTHKGDRWKSRARSYDGALYSDWIESRVVTIGNTRPNPPTAVRLSPLHPKARDDLNAAASGATDPDGTAVTYVYEWARMPAGGDSWEAWSNRTPLLTQFLTAKGDKWKSRACAYDGQEYSEWIESQAVTVGNTAPGPPTAVRINPLTPRTGEDLTATASGGTDVDAEPLTYVYEWSRMPEGEGTWGEWSNRTPVLTKFLTRRGDRWKSRACSYDGREYSEWTESQPVTVGNTAPTAPKAVRVGPRPPRTDDDLVAEASGGTDRDGTEVTYVYQWCCMPEGESGWGEWGNRTPTLTKFLTSRWDRWKARACSYDGQEYSDWTESDPVTVLNTAPTPPTGVRVTPPEPITGDDLTALASGSTDADGNTLTYVYEWARMPAGDDAWEDWGLPGETLPGARTAPGDRWKSRARSYDGYEYSQWAESEAVTVLSQSPAQVAMAAAAAPTGSGLSQITVSLNAPAAVRVSVLNVAGREIAVLPDRSLPRGISTLLWSGRSSTGTMVPSGHYLVRIVARSDSGGQCQTLAPLSLSR